MVQGEGPAEEGEGDGDARHGEEHPPLAGEGTMTRGTRVTSPRILKMTPISPARMEKYSDLSIVETWVPGLYQCFFTGLPAVCRRAAPGLRPARWGKPL